MPARSCRRYPYDVFGLEYGGVQCDKAVCRAVSGEVYPLLPLRGSALAISHRSGRAAAGLNAPSSRPHIMSESNNPAIFSHSGGWPAAAAACSRPPVQPHRVLRVSPDETDMERIIVAAQIQLRRWRQGELGHTSFRSLHRIRRIIAARDSLLALAANRTAILTQAFPIAVDGRTSPPSGDKSAAGTPASAGMAAAPERAVISGDIPGQSPEQSHGMKNIG